MAFFDAPTFNPQAYGGQGGNLLDFLRSLQQQQQVQSSAGFADQPARMVPVGNYQMPRMGAASLYDPQEHERGIRNTEWYREFTQKFGEPPNLNDPDYDYRAAWRAGARPNVRDPSDGLLHWPSEFKGPNHPNRFVNGVDTITGSPAPDSARLPRNAQPTQGALPQQAAPDFGNRLSAGLEGFAAGPGMISKLTGLAQGLSTGQAPTNQTQQALIQKGFDPAIAKQVASNPELLRAVLPSLMGTAGQTDDIKEYQFAKKEQPDLTFQKFMQQKRATSGEYSLTPQYGTNDKGETVLIQTGKSGEAIQTKLPTGVKISSGADKIDLGTQWGIIDKRTGNLIGTQPKDIVGREAAEKIGQAQGTAKVALPAAETTTNRAVRMLNELEKHPGFSEGVGFIVGRLPALTPKAADFRERVEQIDAMVFGDAVEVMRGLGALTDKEGPRVTAARARLKTAKSEQDFRTALKDIREVFNDGIENMRKKAGGSGTAAPAAAPASGVIDYRTYFGNK